MMLRNQPSYRKVFGFLFIVSCFSYMVLKLMTKFAGLSSEYLNLTSKVNILETMVATLLPRVKLKASRHSVHSTVLMLFTYDANNITNNHRKSNTVKHPECNEDYWLIILVQSHITRFNERMRIRKNWGRKENLREVSMKTFFLFSKTRNEDDVRLLENEMEVFGDIIYRDAIEEENELSLKMQMGFSWASRYCHFRYLLKADDNIFVHIPRLYEYLDNLIPTANVYAGNVHYDARVMRSGPYQLSEKQYLKSIYPRYCSASGYVLSADVVMKMSKNIDKVTPIRIEDAYVGELALMSGVDVINVNSFHIGVKGECKMDDEMIIFHPADDVGCMEHLYEEMLKFYDDKFIM